MSLPRPSGTRWETVQPVYCHDDACRGKAVMYRRRGTPRLYNSCNRENAVASMPSPPCGGKADMRCGSGVNGRPPTVARKSAYASSLLLPPLLEDGQSGWHSCRQRSFANFSIFGKVGRKSRLNLLVTFLSREKSRKKNLVYLKK